MDSIRSEILNRTNLDNKSDMRSVNEPVATTSHIESVRGNSLDGEDVQGSIWEDYENNHDMSSSTNKPEATTSGANVGSDRSRSVDDNSLAGKYENDHDARSSVHRGTKCVHYEKIMNALNQTFKLQSLKNNQLQAINATMEGRDCFVLMPTGGGKSLCYQLPAVLSPGVTIVISPLKALMSDQKNKLENLNISVASLNSDMTEEKIDQVYEKLQTPDIKLLYVTPERMSKDRFNIVLKDLLKHKKIARFVVDEAHLILEWAGFRQNYNRLGELLGNLLKEQPDNTETPIMLLTATATPNMITEILKKFKITNCERVLSSINRKNLSYEIREETDQITKDIVRFIQDKFPGQSGIVYCWKKEDCNNLVPDLNNAGIPAAAYHADVSNQEEVSKGWQTGTYQVICATIAFGMGVDKADVRFVIHHSLPRSVLSYCQETGRAGRDGERAACLLYFNKSDVWTMKALNVATVRPGDREKARMEYGAMVRLCEWGWKCRRIQLLEYFGEERKPKFCAYDEEPCDVCREGRRGQRVDGALCRDIARAVRALQARVTQLELATALRGRAQRNKSKADFKKTNLWGLCNTWPEKDVLILLRQFLDLNVLNEYDVPNMYAKTPITYVKIAHNYENQLSQNEFWRKLPPQTLDMRLKTLFDNCYEELLEARSLGSSSGKILCPDSTLKALAITAPESQDALAALQRTDRVPPVYDALSEGLLDVTKKYSRMRNDILKTAIGNTPPAGGNNGNPKGTAKTPAKKRQNVAEHKAAPQETDGADESPAKRMKREATTPGEKRQSVVAENAGTSSGDGGQRSIQDFIKRKL